MLKSKISTPAHIKHLWVNTSGNMCALNACNIPLNICILWAEFGTDASKCSPFIMNSGEKKMN